MLQEWRSRAHSVARCVILRYGSVGTVFTRDSQQATAVGSVHPGDCRALERELLANGCALPIEAATGFPVRSGTARALVEVGLAGVNRWAAVLESSQSRAAPWRSVARLVRVSGVASVAEGRSVAARIAALAVTLGALRMHVEILDVEPHRRERLASALRERGFVRASAPRRYARTIRVDLAAGEDAILAGFHATCRRHIRTFYKKGLRVSAVTDPALAPRLQSLLEESMARSGGTAPPPDWPAFLRFVEGAPDRARLLGAFREDVRGPTALVGYVVGLRHADAVEYATAASTRLDTLKVPLLYAPAWELIRWAKGTGASWFDFGGVLTVAADDPRRGISQFKRMFSEEEIDVGDEFVLEGDDVTARVLSAIRKLRGRFGAD